MQHLALIVYRHSRDVHVAHEEVHRGLATWHAPLCGGRVSYSHTRSLVYPRAMYWPLLVPAWLTYRLGGAVNEAGQWVAVAPAVQVIPAQRVMASEVDSST